MDNQDSINVFKGKNKNEYNIDNLKKEFVQYIQCENLNFLLGSGCSSYIDENGDEKAIPTMKGLFSNFFNQNPDFKIGSVNPKNKCDNNLETMMDYMVSIKMANNLLSVDDKIEDKISTVQEFLKNSIIGGQNSVEISEIYKLFYLKIVQSSAKNPINIFTTNYDQYSEKALDNLGFFYNNGFSGTYLRKFNTNSYNYIFVENMNLQKDVWGKLSHYFNLYKIHGSINWVLEDEEIIEKPVELCDANRIMIYPTPQKDRSTLMTPYSDLMRNMQQLLSKNNSVLVTLGYSFSDDHINRIILNSLSNPSFKLVVLGSGNNINRLIEMNDKRIIVINSNCKIHYFNNFVNELLPDLDENTQEELNLQNGITAIKKFFENNNSGETNE